MEAERNIFSRRWGILLSLVPIIISTEMMWLTLAPVSSLAEQFYQVDSLSIALLAASYMIMYIVFAFPASWVIDKYGYVRSLAIGSLITAVFGIVRAVFADNFTIVLVSQFLIAAGQPFILNISTKVPANWFPHNERSTAAGILTMAQYIGFAVPMIVSPIVAGQSGIPAVLTLYAVIAAVSAVVAVVMARERPPVAPPGPAASETGFNLGELRNLFRTRPFLLVLAVSFISMGVFNTILSLIETILLPRGITSGQAGIVGAVFVIAGVAGAVVLPLISDRIGKRIPFFTGAVAVLVPLYLVFTYSPSFLLLSAAAVLAGFSIMGVAPILFQHGAETAYPVPEGTSLGSILLMGQISGALFVFLFEGLKNSTGSVVVPMIAIVALTAAEIPVTLAMKESRMALQARATAGK